MPQFRQRITTDDRLTERLIKLRRITGDRVKRGMDKRVKRIQRGLQVSLAATAPGPVRYPIQWTSERQRRYVMAKLRRERNLPYRRTHALVRGWKVPKYIDKRGGLLTVTHPWKKVGYVVGDPQRPAMQQRFHAITGWPTAREMEALIGFWQTEARQELQQEFDETVREIIYG
jgi:hypothetical protein